MKNFEIEGIQEMSLEELRQTDGGIFGIIGAVAAVVAVVYTVVYYKGYHDGREAALAESVAA